MPRKTRDIKYHPDADFSKPSIILKSAYIDILQNYKKALQKSHFDESTTQLMEAGLACQTKLKNTLKTLSQKPHLSKQKTQLIKFIKHIQRLSLLCSRVPTPSEDTINKLLDHIRKTPQPSKKFFKYMQPLTKFHQKDIEMLHHFAEAKKHFQTLQNMLKSPKKWPKTYTYPPVIYSLQQLLPSIDLYIDSAEKFFKTAKPSKKLIAALNEANLLKKIVEEHEKR